MANKSIEAFSEKNAQESAHVEQDQEIIIGKSGRAVLLNAEEEILWDNKYPADTNMRSRALICPNWLRSSSSKTKLLLIVFSILFLVFIGMVFVGIIVIPSQGNGVGTSENISSAQLEDIAAQKASQQSLDVEISPSKQPSPQPSFQPNSGSKIIPINDSRIKIAFSNALEQTIPDFTDTLTSSEKSDWQYIEDILQDTIGVTLLKALPADYSLGSIEILSFDDNDVYRAYADNIHNVVYSSSVIVSCATSDCAIAADAVMKAVEDVANMDFVKVVRDSTTFHPTKKPVEKSDITDEINVTDPVETTTVTTSTAVLTDTIDQTTSSVNQTLPPTANPSTQDIAALTFNPSSAVTIERLPLKNDNCSPSSPCDVCSGGCRNDADCIEGLLCFNRLYLEYIPGCEGPGNAGQPYCYDPYSDGLTEDLLLSTSDQSCSYTNRCLKCEGDCETDDDCEMNLFCFKRSGYELVPGCAGQGSFAYDYCFDPEDIRSTNHY